MMLSQEELCLMPTPRPKVLVNKELCLYRNTGDRLVPIPAMMKFCVEVTSLSSFAANAVGAIFSKSRANFCLASLGLTSELGKVYEGWGVSGCNTNLLTLFTLGRYLPSTVTCSSCWAKALTAMRAKASMRICLFILIMVLKVQCRCYCPLWVPCVPPRRVWRGLLVSGRCPCSCQ